MDDLDYMRKVAGLTSQTESYHNELTQLQEVVDATVVTDLEDATNRFAACKRALALVNKFTDPVDRKKWRSATMVNLNKIRAALTRIEKRLRQEDADDQTR